MRRRRLDEGDRVLGHGSERQLADIGRVPVGALLGRDEAVAGAERLEQRLERTRVGATRMQEHEGRARPPLGGPEFDDHTDTLASIADERTAARDSAKVRPRDGAGRSVPGCPSH